jgi:hypothetical protein
MIFTRGIREKVYEELGSEDYPSFESLMKEREERKKKG